MAGVQSVLWKDVTANVAERLHRRKTELSKRPYGPALVEKAYRAVRAKDVKVLQVLEKMANLLDQLGEHQYGETRRQASQPLPMRVPPTEVSMWREAYRLAEEGKDGSMFGWYYAAVLEFVYAT